MIKASELRIGNHVAYELQGKNEIAWGKGIITAINKADLYLNTIRFDYPDLNGIKLTPEILEQCGFEKDNTHNCYVIWQNESDVAIEFFNDTLHLVGQASAEPLEHCKYLHQLQNLIYSLTGEELSVTNPSASPSTS
jgi:hypothetical protein